MPDVESQYHAGYLVSLLFEAGLMSINGMSPVPISWLEIDAWLRVTGMQLATWEILLLKQMSEVYVAERCETDKDRPAPYRKRDLEEDEIVEQRNKVETNLKNFLSQFKRKN